MEKMPEFYSNEFCDLFGIKNPIIQAPMAGGISTPKLVCAVIETGSLGFLAAGYLSVTALEEQILEVKSKTQQHFGINLFLVDPIQVENCHKPKSICEIEKELGIYKSNSLNLDLDEENDKKLELILKHKLKIVSFTFGLPSKKWVEKLKKNGVYLIGNCTNLIEATELQKAGFDALVAQGSEAGGHRGSFAKNETRDEIGLFSLLQELKNSIKIPIIAAGGITNGKSILAAKILGATAMQIGTGFLLTHESGASDAYKNEILNSHAHEMVFTEQVSGKKARGKNNTLIEKLSKNHENIFSFPVQNALTREIRNHAQKNKNSQYMSLWCGQSISTIKKIKSVKNFIADLIDEYNGELRQLNHIKPI